jgi:radical SAM protein with 4Fe4S-binding SPASM domain
MLDSNRNIKFQFDNMDSVLLQDAYKKFNSGLFYEAEKILYSLKLKYPYNPEIMNDYGVCLWTLGNFKEAIWSFVEALILDPYYKEARYNLYKCYEAVNYERKRSAIFGDLNSIDLSKPYAVKGVQRFVGWSLSGLGLPIERIEVSLNDEIIGYAEYGIPRFDVLIKHPDLTGAYNSGFRFDLNTIDLPPMINTKDKYKITISACAGNHKSVIKEGFLEINNKEISPFDENAAKAYKSFREKRTVLDSYPLSIILEPTRSCNLKCIMCRPQPVSSPSLSFETVNKLIPYLPYVKLITMSGSGEPFLHPRFLEILKIVCEYSHPASVIGFNTNAMLLDEEKIDFLISLSINHITFSVDSPNKVTYEKIRNGASFDILVKNLDQIIKSKKLYNADKPYIIFQMVVMKSNVHEIPEYVSFANEYGVKDIMIVNMEAYERQGAVSCVEPFHEHRQYMEYYLKAKQLAYKNGITLHGTAVKSFESLLCPDSLTDDFSVSTKEGILCPEPYQSMYISAEGNISPCPYLNDAGIFLGDINKQSLKDIWNSAMYVSFRESLLEGRLHQMCRYCLKRGLMCQAIFHGNNK